MIEHRDYHEELLAWLSPDRVKRTMGVALLDGARDIAEDAAFSIRDGAISGAGHVPSLPGSPPNNDTGELAASIHVGELIEVPGRLETAVIADADHALYLELGTMTIAERPFIRPATTRGRAPLIRRLAAAFRRAIAP